MKSRRFIGSRTASLAVLAIAGAAVWFTAIDAQKASPARDYPVKPAPFTAVHLNDVFWAP
jgi:hypothetical protein